MAEKPAASVVLSRKEMHALAEALVETPESFISIHLLRRGLCRAYVLGRPERFTAAIIQDGFNPSEPVGFGSDPGRLWDLLSQVQGWKCLEVSPDCAQGLAGLMGRDLGVRVRLFADIYHCLRVPVRRFANEVVRRLTLADLTLLEAARAEVRAVGYGSAGALLAEGVVACAVVNGKVVSIVQTCARTARYVDIGVATLPGYRGRGLATAAASLVAHEVQRSGQIPVWSAGESNEVSLRIAARLGFVEVSRRTYLIPEATSSAAAPKRNAGTGREDLS